ncbi:histidine kinase [Rufibacter radiotolerans]|uniref:Histidine kinase n=1 Tax=Rufibacter radiotolerans TaxID=1379910 RepID=A0A0H4VJV9_9BACT|nr:histidine kinase [Rufibacter radiotolerans]AKQ45643.1 histidine kinase [Rufibacter radiotolerans]
MKSILPTPTFQSKIEFWAAITIFAFAVLFLVTGPEVPYLEKFQDEGIRFYYYRNFFTPQLLQFIGTFLTVLILNFILIPKLLAKEKVAKNVLWVLLAFLFLGLLFSITNTYLQAYRFGQFRTEEDTYESIFLESFHTTLTLFALFAFYTFIKYVSTYLLTNSAVIQNRFRFLTRDVQTAFVVFLVSMFLLFLADADGEVLVAWGITAPLGILYYCYSFYYLIPKSLPNKKPFRSYMSKSVLVWVLAYLPVALVSLIFIHDEETAFAYSLVNSIFQLFVTLPLVWMLYKRQMKGKEEVAVLQKELGTSNANLDFLRSQINPHFLFNALNTLYGTALQENSDRTAQGIQMLGDMMRFMLHENLQQKILLSREVEYMRNYIDLQMLRISTSPNIQIQTKIEDVIDDKFIAPMLLIPFVENAFKHGISLKNQSWIKITLHCDQNKLYFDVYNSAHAKTDNDPEKNQSGIGLVNVKQRLALLYPGKHELIIRNTPEEYFVHLTLQL